MEFIGHRVNSVSELKQVPKEFGIEIDLRDDLNGRIYISHNPFEDGEDFEEYLKCYEHGTLILNIKSERIEFRIKEMLEQHNIKNYFFLDSSFPMIYTLANAGETNIALRFSEFEKMDTLVAMAGKVKWVWIDCFSKIPVTAYDLMKIKDMGYSTCFVSPELQGRPEDLERYIDIIREGNLKFDAVCSKVYNADKWMKL